MRKSYWVDTKDWRGIALIVMLLSFFLSDSLNVLFGSSCLFESEISRYFRFSTLTRGGAFLLVLIWFLFRRYNIRQILFWGVVLMPILWIGLSKTNDFDAVIWGHQLSRFAFPLLLFVFMEDISEKNKSMLERLFFGIIILQVAAVLIGLLLQIELFWSYNSHRFGYSGLIFAVNQATFFYVIAGVFLYVKWKAGGGGGYRMILLALLCVTFLLGAKAVLIFVFSLVVLDLFFLRTKAHTVQRIFVVGGVFVIGLIVFAFIGIKLGYADFHIQSIREYGWVYYVSSARNLLVVENAWPLIKNWDWYNYLFGGANPVIHFAQMDILDLFLFSGIAGSIFYYRLLFRGMFRFDKSNKIGWFLVIQYFVIGALSGHVFASGINALYLVILSHTLQDWQSQKDYSFVSVS